MSEKITVEWQVSDGYVARVCGPQSFSLDKEEFYSCNSQDEIIDYIHKCAQDDFEEKVTYRITNLHKVTEEIKAYLKELKGKK